jgi:hypothetical protein
MAIIYKRSTGRMAASALIFTGPCWYYGFTGLPGGANRTVEIYNNTAASGTKVEDFIMDGAKPTDGHSHAIPCYCSNGLYAAFSAGSINVFYKPAKTE